MNRETLLDIMKRRAGWRLFWPPWTLREDMEILASMALGSLPEENAPACPVPLPDCPKPDPQLQLELEKAKKANVELSRWIMRTFKLDQITPTGKVVDLLASPITIISNPAPK